MNKADSAKYFGPIELNPGITHLHVITFLLICFLGIPLTSFIGFIQPYVLTEQLQMPENIQGTVTGDLVFYSEFILLAGSVIAGILADTFGRRLVIIAGLITMLIGYLFFGLVENYWQLLILRLWFAAGIACISVMISTIMADIPSEHSRGKFVGLSSVFIGFGAIFLGLVLAKLPSYFSEIASKNQAGIYTFYSLAGIAALLGITSLFGVKKWPDNIATRPPISIAIFISQIKEGLYEGRKNLRVALAYGASFVSRGDLIVVGTFYSLWLKQEGLMQGISSEEAIKTAGLFFVVAQTAGLLWAPIAGILNDRLDRVMAMALSLIIASIGYGSMGLINNPLGHEMYVGAILLGIGQMGVMISCQTLIGQEAPRSTRASIMGIFTLFGALGILFISKVGGITYDLWKPSPFVIVGAVNLSLFLFTLWLRKHEGKNNLG